MTEDSPFSENTPIFLHPQKREQLFRQAQDLFNEGQFFEAHEAWETLWKLENQKEDRNFLQGLIFICAHFIHLKKNNSIQAMRSAQEAMNRLKAPKNNFYLQMDQEPLLSALEYNLSIIQQAQLPTINLNLFLVPRLETR